MGTFMIDFFLFFRNAFIIQKFKTSFKHSYFLHEFQNFILVTVYFMFVGALFSKFAAVLGQEVFVDFGVSFQADQTDFFPPTNCMCCNQVILCFVFNI